MTKTTTETPIKVRFAPSPTGFLHIGGARTALFNWLYARAKGGKFLIRIEDTDTERSEARFTADIMESLKWLGMLPDEEPVFQSHRFPRYTEIANQLLAAKQAYRCECTPEQLDKVREQCQAEKRPFRYPGTCREKTSVAPNSVVRVKVPQSGETGFDDLIRGHISVRHSDVDDWVILRGNGSPTYNFSVVIDDHDLGITHVLRGDDHINNTPKQILLYQSLGFAVPHFAHLPMILGPDKTKLSKRHGAASTLEYRGMGYLPETMINFLVRLGWSHGDQEIFTIPELHQFFDLDHIGKASAVFSPDKLNWVSGQIMTRAEPPRLREYIHQYFPEKLDFLKGLDEKLELAAIAAVQAKVKNVHELIDQLGCLFGPDPAYDLSTTKEEEKQKMLGFLKQMQPSLQESDFSKADLETRLKAEAGKLGIKLTPLAQALRYSVTGGKHSPALFDMLELQGRERVLRRVENALQALSR